MSTPNELWRNLCRLVSVDPTARGALNAAHSAIGASVGRTTLQRISEGVQPRLSSLTKIARALGVDVSELLGNGNFVHESYRASLQLAHAVSHRERILPTKQRVWEDLVREPIEGQFILAIKGDALAPQYLPGQLGIWQAGPTARAGQPVLLRLPNDRFELRIYEDRGETWAGIALKAGHRILTPEHHKAEIVARLRYLDLD